MADLAGLMAIVMSLGMAPAIIYIRGQNKLKERRLELEAKTGGSGEDAKRLTEENKLLRERVENLESIVCSVDFELNQKLAKVIDEQRSLVLPAGPAAPPPPDTASVKTSTPRRVARLSPSNNEAASLKSGWIAPSIGIFPRDTG